MTTTYEMERTGIEPATPYYHKKAPARLASVVLGNCATVRAGATPELPGFARRVPFERPTARVALWLPLVLALTGCYDTPEQRALRVTCERLGGVWLPDGRSTLPQLSGGSEHCVREIKLYTHIDTTPRAEGGR